MSRYLISDAHEWNNEIPYVPPVKEGWQIMRQRVTKSAKLALRSRSRLLQLTQGWRWDCRQRYWGGIDLA